jgi:hypothetical protein
MLYRERAAGTAARWSDLLPAGARYAEAFQISDYGDRPATDEIARLFPCGAVPGS